MWELAPFSLWYSLELSVYLFILFYFILLFSGFEIFAGIRRLKKNTLCFWLIWCAFCSKSIFNILCFVDGSRSPFELHLICFKDAIHEIGSRGDELGSVSRTVLSHLVFIRCRSLVWSSFSLSWAGETAEANLSMTNQIKQAKQFFCITGAELLFAKC